MFSRRRYMTARVSREVDPIARFFLWSCINLLTVETDYLQVFDLEVTPDG